MSTKLLSKEIIPALYHLFIGLFCYWKMVEKTSPCLFPMAFGKVMCTHSQVLSVLSEYLWYPKNLNVRVVDKRADISHLKAGKRSVLWNKQADLEIKFTGGWLRDGLRGQVLSGNRGNCKVQYGQSKNQRSCFCSFFTFPSIMGKCGGGSHALLRSILPPTYFIYYLPIC